MNKNEFEKYALRHAGISSLKLHNFRSISNEYISPTIIEERQLNVATMDVFSRLMMDRIIFLGVPIYDDAANIIQAQMLFLESTEPEKDIQIYINSPGGSVTAGLGIYDTMQLISSDVATICTGLAASMGAVLLTAGTAGKRSALPHSRVMIHQPLGGVEGQASDIEITAKQILRTKQELYEILASHSGVDIKKIEKDADRDYWMTAPEAKEYGLIDEVLVNRGKLQRANTCSCFSGVILRDAPDSKPKQTPWQTTKIITVPTKTTARSADSRAARWGYCLPAATGRKSATNVSNAGTTCSPRANGYRSRAHRRSRWTNCSNRPKSRHSSTST